MTSPTPPDQGDERRAFEAHFDQMYPMDTDSLSRAIALSFFKAGRASLSSAQPVAQEASKVEWVDGQGGRHAVTIPYAAELLKQLFDEWPDGVNEIEAALRWRDREIARLTPESVSGEVSTGQILALERRSNMTDDEAIRYARSVLALVK